MGRNWIGQLSNRLCSWYTKNKFANVGPKGQPITTPSICNKKKRKQEHLTERIRSCLKWHLSVPFTFLLFPETMSTQMSIVSSNGIFVNNNWMSEDTIKRFGSWSPISLENRNYFDGDIDLKWINTFQHSVAFDIETSHLICSIYQMTGVYMNCNNGLRWVRVNVTVALKGNMIASSKCHHVSQRSKKGTLSWNGLIASLTIGFYEKYALKNDLKAIITCMKIHEPLQFSWKIQNFHLFGPPVVARMVLWNRVCPSFCFSSVLPSVWGFSWNCIIRFF